ncbi:MAG: glycoside hydrolase [Nitrospirae bacterium]|nr:MAG: glycoside hydrolase [Nitrospirota bacterium]
MNRDTQTAFPYTVTDDTKYRKLSAAMRRSFDHYPAPRPEDNELYSQFRYTPLQGFDYNDGDGTLTRRDPSMVIFENGKYYVWYTRRNTAPVQGPEKHTDTIPSADWDLAEIWYATSEDGFTWEEQGVAVPRPPKPYPGWRSVATPGILKFEDRFYLYYQAFSEPPMVRGDYCPVAASWADSPDGPWTPANEEVVPTGAAGEWDQYAIHDPHPLVHDGKVYLYYKSAFNRPHALWVAQGLAIAGHPLGPFTKHPLNPVLNSSHETAYFPFKQGVACLSICDGQEHFTIQYAEDWVNFEIAAITELMPTAAGPFAPDAFTDTGDGRGITWGLCHFTNAGNDWSRQHTILARFDCDLSRDIHDPEMKRSHYRYSPEHHFRFGLSRQQRERIDRMNRELKLQHGQKESGT